MFDDVKCVHLVGAGGIGVSAIGKWFLAQGASVSGSDVTESNITGHLAACGARLVVGHAAEHVPADCDLVVYTEAAGEENVERAEAKRRGIRQLGHFDFLGELSKGMRTICITGTNGKSTTTAMTGKIFEAAGLDPTVFVGSIVPGWELGNLRVGKSDIFIVEGDEYKRKMLALHPETTVITNIEMDHADVYKDIADVEAAFRQLCKQTTQTVILNTKDRDRGICERAKFFGGDAVVSRSVGVPGIFNRMNASAAKAVALEYGIAEEVIAKSLREFYGIWRRFERVGDYRLPTTDDLVPVISDYGHHPTAVKATLEAARELFPGRRIVLCFQPHQHNRTRELFDDFATSFAGADVLILAEVYDVAGRNGDANISSRDLLGVIQEPTEKFYAADLADAEGQLRTIAKDGDVILVMGAGDIDAVARKMVEKI